MRFKLLHKLGEATLTPVLDELELHADLWNNPLGNARARYAGSAHKDTQAIILRWCPHVIDGVFTEIDTENREEWSLLPYSAKLASYVSRLTGKALARVLFAKLAPGGHITPHIDEGAYAAATWRIHVVVQADEGNVFRVEREYHAPTVGEVLRINVRKEHEVWNGSSRPRIHLITDVFQ
jgi:hypothetical protein